MSLESSPPPSRTSNHLQTLAATTTHGLCWLTLVVWQFQFVPLVLHVLEDIEAEMPSITPLVLRLKAVKPHYSQSNAGAQLENVTIPDQADIWQHPPT